MAFSYPGMSDFTTPIDPIHAQNVIHIAYNLMPSEEEAYSYSPFPLPGGCNPYPQELNVAHDDFNFMNVSWDLAGDIPPLVYPPFLTPPFDIDPLFLSPPATTPGASVTPSPPHLPPPDLPLVDSPATQVPASTQSTPPPTQPAPWQPNADEVEKFDFCPYTEDGKVCGFVSWTNSGNKTIARHLRRVHFKPGSNAIAWKCPNPRCKNMGRSFRRRDSLVSHRRKTCDLWHSKQDPYYVAQPHIQDGSDAEVKRWIKAAHRQRNAIKRQLRAGTSWSVGLLQPTYL